MCPSYSVVFNIFLISDIYRNKFEGDITTQTIKSTILSSSGKVWLIYDFVKHTIIIVLHSQKSGWHMTAKKEQYKNMYIYMHMHDADSKTVLKYNFFQIDFLIHSKRTRYSSTLEASLPPTWKPSFWVFRRFTKVFIQWLCF